VPFAKGKTKAVGAPGSWVHFLGLPAPMTGVRRPISSNFNAMCRATHAPAFLRCAQDEGKLTPSINRQIRLHQWGLIFALK
jgi:hypothetical protein